VFPVVSEQSQQLPHFTHSCRNTIFQLSYRSNTIVIHPITFFTYGSTKIVNLRSEELALAQLQLQTSLFEAYQNLTDVLEVVFEP
jgi:hypothetical protein